MEENNEYIIISSYDDEVRYFNNVIDDKEHRAPIFTGDGECGKSGFIKMITKNDIDEERVKLFLSRYNNL